MVIGALHGRVSLDEDDSLALALASRYRERFWAEFGATQCARLREGVHSPGGLGSCALVVEHAVRILLELVTEHDRGS
jgi:hypothetical protein